MIATLLSAAILLANLCVLGLNLKLYTEYFKDKSQDSRNRSKTNDH